MRRFVLLAALFGTLVAGWWAGSDSVAAEGRTVRDTIWIWAHYEGTYDNQFGLPRNSPITPIEGARSMGVRNVILICCNGRPKPPFDAYAAPFRAFDKVMWSVTGASGATSEKDRGYTLALAAKMPNITGVFMDDFFGALPNEKDAPVQAAMSVEELKQLRPRLLVNGRRLDLGVTLYTYQLDKRCVPHLEQCDIIGLWTWASADLAKLEDNFAKCQALLPGKRIFLGLYMWDFSIGKPMPLDLMKKQCTLALKWLREGRIEGMIFLATNICDMHLEAVNWTRRWIAEVGDQPLDAPTP